MSESKIRWRPLTTFLLVAGAVAILVAVAVSYIVTAFQPRTEVVVGSQPYRLIVADDDTSRVKGLSGVEELKKDDGLLMVFDEDDLHGIWMKDMLVPLDIIWLDANKKVIYIVQDAKPELSTDTIFTPRKPARYVVELPSGSVRQHGVRVGHEVQFNLEETSLWW